MRSNAMAFAARSLFIAWLLVTVALSATAQDYPTRPVRLIVPFPPGASTNDVLGRLIAQRLSESLGQQFVVENRPGAGGTIGTELVAKAPPDGYTLLIGTNGPIAIGPHVYPKLGYDPLKDLDPVNLFAMVPYAIVVNATSKANNLQDLVAMAKASPGQLAYASSGNGSPAHLCGELLRGQSGIGHRSAGRPGADLLPRTGLGTALNPDRQAQGHRGDDAQAHSLSSRCSDLWRTGARRARREFMGGPDGSGRNATGHRQPVEPGDS